MRIQTICLSLSIMCYFLYLLLIQIKVQVPILFICALQVATINPTIFGIALKEWKFFQSELDKLRHIDWMECPCCNVSQHSVHVDGNMKLYRFKSTGTWVVFLLHTLASCNWMWFDFSCQSSLLMNFNENDQHKVIFIEMLNIFIFYLILLKN